MRFIFTLLIVCSVIGLTNAQFVYINPRPGSDYHYPQTNIILKNGNRIERESAINNRLVTIRGSISGKHSFTARLSDDNKTVIIKPNPVFAWDEEVTVTINSVLETISNEKINGIIFQFKIRKEPTAEDLQRSEEAKRYMFMEEFGYDPGPANLSGTRDKEDTVVVYPLDSMPTITININDNPCPGRIFYTNHETQTGAEPFTNSFNTVIENDGTIVYAEDVGKEGRDFKINYNGYISYFIAAREMYMILDSNFNIIDSVTMGNGFENATNNHDMVMYPDHHFFLIGYDNRETDMTAYGGQPDATVQYLVLQELDSNRDVIFEWHGEDYFQFTDANQYTSLTNSTVDYIHCNSLQRDNDGNLLISNRNMNELTKINLTTGDIIWRMGGENNQFTFVNDENSQHFASQHYLRRIENGNIIIFNNANHMIPQISSAKEYSLDETDKVATLVWYYQHPDVNGTHVYGSATGSAQRLPNGNTIIYWGLTPSNAGIPNQTEVDYDKNIKWEMTFDSSAQKCYRVHKYFWWPCPRPTGGLTKVKKITDHSAKVDWAPVTEAISYDIRYKKIGNSGWKEKTSIIQSSRKLRGLKPDMTYVFQIRSHCDSSKVSGWTQIDTFKTLPLKTEVTKEFVTDLYPNPASNTLQLTVNSEEEEQMNISLIDITGKVVMSQTRSIGEGEQLIQLDISALSPGFYFIELKNNSQKSIRKFIKQ